MECIAAASKSTSPLCGMDRWLVNCPKGNNKLIPRVSTANETHCALLFLCLFVPFPRPSPVLTCCPFSSFSCFSCFSLFALFVVWCRTCQAIVYRKWVFSYQGHKAVFKKVGFWVITRESYTALLFPYHALSRNSQLLTQPLLRMLITISSELLPAL